MNILLLEDSIALNKAITKVLQLDNYNVTSYTDGKDVLENLNNNHDLYILDINVPNINGLELLDLIYTNDKSSKVIIISSNSDIYSLKQAYNLGCVDYLNKPFHLEELRIKINKLKIKKSDEVLNIKLKNGDDTLTKKEKILLMLLVKNQDTTVTYEMIETNVYKNSSMSMDSLRALVRRLRVKLSDIIIENVLDEGYKISSNK